MLKIFYEIDEMDNIEANLLAEASNRLDIGEFQVFQLSYKDWFGNDLDSKTLEKFFFAYLIDNRIPPWARHFSRKIIEMDDRGELDFNDPAYHVYDVASMRPRARKVGAAKAMAALLVAAATFAFSLYLLHGYEEGEFPCHFPPCIKSQ